LHHSKRSGAERQQPMKFRGKSRLVMIFIRLLAFYVDNLVGSTNGLDPTDLKVVGSGPKVRVEIDASAIFACY